MRDLPLTGRTVRRKTLEARLITFTSVRDGTGEFHIRDVVEGGPGGTL